MYLQSLSTARILDTIKDRLDDYRSDEVISHAQWTKLTSFRKMLKSLNEADLQLCGDLKLETQVVIYLPEDTSILYLRSNEYQSGQHTSAINDLITKEPNGNHEYLFNLSMYRNISTLRSGFITGYKTFPLGVSAPSSRYAVVPFTEFQKSQSGQTYCDDRFGVLPVAHVDHGRGIIQLSRVQNSGTYLSFKAYVMPEKVDFAEVANTREAVEAAYTPVSPNYTESLLVLMAIIDLLPESNPLLPTLDARQSEAFNRARLRVPMDSSTKTVESWL